VYSKILVPLDGSKLAEQILPFVRSIAEPHGVPVEFLTVTDPEARPPFWPPQVGEDYLRKVCANYLAASECVASAVDSGEPGEVIVDRAKSDPGCLIAMATHGLSGIRRWLLGSITSKVVQTAVNPLLLIRPVQEVDSPANVRIRTLFVPLDGSSLAEKVLPHVSKLAKQMKLKVHLIQVYTLPQAAYVVAEGIADQGPALYREAMRKETESYLGDKAEQLRSEGLEHVSTSVLEGDAASEIIDIARAAPDNLIAMSTHGRSGIKRWVLGSVAEKVIHHSGDPVLIIRAI
jgi:nucleotide-binding universal stress UspA family protein